ncbi:biotin--[acetyl-CoA-carboxylase] ligase [Clostridiisalibacter paucivorans]|uniref:biotin--[acetyl-CoA-carboxylase] ligase n=1 Tax=Clostridiisalibacter paucivorans TaxID=408753 RepID=UPI00047969B0|nr:biotin--[acetyl-CoA-carboxylase] ligase [Clostridiisalibacter paucivorans]
MKEKIIKYLKDNKESFMSGQQISEKLGISRTSVWKHINQLKAEGYDIKSFSRKGYKLMDIPDILTEGEIKDMLNTKFIGKHIVHFDTVKSTNVKSKELAEEGALEGTVILSEEQIGGRGRLGRDWISPKGKGIWMSVILKPNIDPIHASKITQIAAAAVYDGIKNIGLDPGIKWPNDIVLNEKKVCGILTEMSGELNKINYIVVGIGINVNLNENDIPNEIKDKATSILIEKGSKEDRKKLVSNILNKFEILYDEFIESGKLTETIDICREGSVLLGKEIRILSQGKEKDRAMAVDIDDNGQLIVEYRDKRREKLFSGEISIRGINGYF